jgi:uncharacterized protein YcbK (DUF882 family)
MDADQSKEGLTEGDEPAVGDAEPAAGDAEPDELEQLKAERDKAIAARNLIVQELLLAGQPQPRPRSRRLLAVFLTVILLASLVLLARFVMKLKRMRGVKDGPTIGQKVTRKATPKHAQPASRSRKQRTFRPTRISLISLAAVSQPTTMVLAPGSRKVAIGGVDGEIAVYDLTTDTFFRFPPSSKDKGGGAIRKLAFAEGGIRLLSASRGGTVNVWDMGKRRKLTQLLDEKSTILDLAAGGDWLALARGADSVLLVNWKTGEKRRLETKGAIRAVALSEDSKWLATGAGDGKITVWSRANGTRIRTFSDHKQWISALAFSPTGETLASASFDKKIRLWKRGTGRLLHRLEGHVQRANSLSFDRTEAYLVSASLDRRAIVWDCKTGRSFRELVGHRWQLVGAAFEARRRFVVTASGDGTLRIWPGRWSEPRATQKLGPPEKGVFTLRQNTTGERRRIRLLDKKGNLLDAGRRELAHITRSIADNRSLLPEPDLVKLLIKVSQHFGAERELTVISGFRSPQYNALRTKQSKQVAKQSRHMRGQAIDLRIEGIPITTLRDYLRSLKAGGVGFYADSQFVHLDTGRVRYWTGD